MTLNLPPLNDHPAAFSKELFDLLIEELGRSEHVLDPFSGTGRIHALAEAAGVPTSTGIELEPEWSNVDLYPTVPRLQVIGDARRWIELISKSFPFDYVCTSPCVAQEHRILTDDLRWVPAGDIEIGQRIVAFNEHALFTKANGHAARLRWEWAEVTRSEPKQVPCVRVIMENGDFMITTPNHPWLVQRYSYGGRASEWTTSIRLMGSPALGRTRGHRSQSRQPYYVAKQFSETWTQRTSFDAGWLSGMFDGEGSLSMGVHGAPKMTACQVVGPLLDRMETLMSMFGYDPNRIVRTSTPEHRQKVGNLYVTGGFPGILRALGELRPLRLLSNWQNCDISTRSIQPEWVKVVAVEDAGLRDIQEIETTSGTYITDGYLHHNSYANRMADHHDAKEKCKACKTTGKRRVDGVDLECEKCGGLGIRKYTRNTYKHRLGRDLTTGNSGAMQWIGSSGDEYRDLHRDVWTLCAANLPVGGWFILNCKDHYRKDVLQPVTQWHVDTLEELGLTLDHFVHVPCKGNRQGQNREKRAEHEDIYTFIKEQP